MAYSPKLVKTSYDPFPKIRTVKLETEVLFVVLQVCLVFFTSDYQTSAKIGSPLLSLNLPLTNR